MSGLVSVQWLKKHISDEGIVLLEAVQKSSVNSVDHSLEGHHIPGSLPFDLQLFSDVGSDLPNTIPDAESFEHKCQQLGISKGSKLIIYDAQGVYFSPRVWWMFQVMGHIDVAVLNGGLPAWIDQGGPIVGSFDTVSDKGDFEATLIQSLVKSYEEVFQNLSSKDFQIVDARSQGRFIGSAPEPRKGLSSGHIPDSLNIPYEDVLDGYFLKSSVELKEIFPEGVAEKQPVFSCGSGLTACILALANFVLTEEVSPVYDGSWTEWAQQPKSPIEKIST